VEILETKKEKNKIKYEEQKDKTSKGKLSIKRWRYFYREDE